MDSLRFDKDVTLDEVFDQHQSVIYDQVLKSICDSYQDSDVVSIPVIKITIGNHEYSINLSRERFEECLRNAIAFYEGVEAYEKCKVCFDIINELKKEKKESA